MWRECGARATSASPGTSATRSGNDRRRDPMRHYVRPDRLPPVNGYSHAVAFAGPMIVVSGQVPVNAGGRLVGKDDPAAQIRQVFENLTAALAAAGAGMDQVVKLTVF